MLSIQARVQNHNYSSPSSYWLTHLCTQDVEPEAAVLRTDPKLRRRTQMRRLRYKQTHSWTARLWHDLMAMFGFRHRALLASY
jgi:hypothetical protein